MEEAKADLPRAALGTLLHLGDPDGTAVAYRTLCAVYELHGLDMFAWMYYPKTDFEREHFYKGKSEGKAEGRAERA